MKYLTIFFLLISLSLFGQKEIKPKEIKGSWFTENTFFFSDTVVLFKRTNLQPDNDFSPPYIEPIQELLENKPYINLFFKHCHKINYWKAEHPTKKKSETGKWKLKNDIITIKSKDNIWTFQLISKEKVEFNCIISNHSKKFHTPKWILKRIK